MVSWKKVALVAAVLAGLTTTYAGAAQGAPAAACERDDSGNVVCSDKTDYRSKDGKYHVSQVQSCVTGLLWGKLPRPTDLLFDWVQYEEHPKPQEKARVDCSNHAPSNKER
ncbi:hypothetical protein ACQUSR_10565 [Streptomyces sp. P1-3]|uniref:hypothetical protein n=1 Tax=Streptomyces sp. P1-3 TaxID=3421658 RepID=UPI003D35F52C